MEVFLEEMASDMAWEGKQDHGAYPGRAPRQVSWSMGQGLKSTRGGMAERLGMIVL